MYQRGAGPTSFTIGRMRPSSLSSSAIVALLLLGGPLPAAAPQAAEAGAAPGPASAAPTAAAVLQKARAAAGKRNVFVAFHASWCIWCKALEKLTLLPGTKPVFDRYYTVAWLTVDERTSRKSLENAGADEVRTRLGGDGVALPFYGVVDLEGKVLATSARRGLDGKKENVGFPAAPDEVEDFLAIFRAGAPDLTESEEKALVDGIASLAKR